MNPPEWIERVPDVVSGYPHRIIARAGYEKALEDRTLTKLYNERPTWPQNAHRDLDTAVAQACGWNDYTPEMPDDELLSRLLKLNLARAQG